MINQGLEFSSSEVLSNRDQPFNEDITWPYLHSSWNFFLVMTSTYQQTCPPLAIIRGYDKVTTVQCLLVFHWKDLIKCQVPWLWEKCPEECWHSWIRKTMMTSCLLRSTSHSEGCFWPRTELDGRSLEWEIHQVGCSDEDINCEWSIWLWQRFNHWWNMHQCALKWGVIAPIIQFASNPVIATAALSNLHRKVSGRTIMVPWITSHLENSDLWRHWNGKHHFVKVQVMKFLIEVYGLETSYTMHGTWMLTGNKLCSMRGRKCPANVPLASYILQGAQNGWFARKIRVQHQF